VTVGFTRGLMGRRLVSAPHFIADWPGTPFVDALQGPV
jgi:hypothetical protein